jgi:hypothetical protein
MKKHNLYLKSEKYSENDLENNIHLFDERDWEHICANQKLSEKFIEKYSDKVCWESICCNQNLSECFIEKHMPELDSITWDYISYYQILSEEFIRKHIHKINVFCLMENIKICNNIKQEINLLKEII